MQEPKSRNSEFGHRCIKGLHGLHGKLILHVHFSFYMFENKEFVSLTSNHDPTVPRDVSKISVGISVTILKYKHAKECEY